MDALLFMTRELERQRLKKLSWNELSNYIAKVEFNNGVSSNKSITTITKTENYVELICIFDIIQTCSALAYKFFNEKMKVIGQQKFKKPIDLIDGDQLQIHFSSETSPRKRNGRRITYS